VSAVTDEASLVVELYGEPVGELIRSRRGNTYGFRYAGSWLTRDGASALSRSLPLEQIEYSFEQCQPFFSGLLPEGPAREALARALHVSPGNDFSLLERIGGDCAGAVSIVPSESVREPDVADIAPLSDAELAEILRQLPRRPFLAGGADRVRLSLAGSQSKLPVIYDGSLFRLPKGSPSTHIIKIGIAQLDGIVENEALCLGLASRLGLQVVSAEPMRLAEIEFLLVARYDRLGAGAETQRIHQEDVCQALGIPSNAKYENEGGPSIRQLSDLVRSASARAGADRLELLSLTVFNFLIANSDAHGKNFSLVYHPQGTRLAPAYDLVCASVYPDIEDRLAMKIGGQYDPRWVRRSNWERLADDLGLGRGGTLSRLRGYADRAPEVAREVARGLVQSGWREDVLDRVIAVIDERVTSIQRELSDIEPHDPLRPRRKRPVSD
jgi:serine/threonine-protein kinase HipA